MKSIYSFLLFLVSVNGVMAQGGTIKGMVRAAGRPIEAATIIVAGTNLAQASDTLGHFQFNQINEGSYLLKISAVGYLSVTRQINITGRTTKEISIELSPASGDLDAVVVTGTMKPVSKSESPIPVEVYTPTFLRKILPQFI